MERVQIVFGIRVVSQKQFPEISFFDTTPEYKNITLVPIDPDISLYEIWVNKNVDVATGDAIAIVLQEATTEAQNFVYVFSVAANLKIFDFSCKGYRHNDSFKGIEHIFGRGGLRIFTSGRLTVVAGTEFIEETKQKMQQNYDLSKLQLFFDSATVSEPIGRFISLYTLMLHYCADNQKKVDEAIVEIDPTVAQYKSPKGHWYETVFTKLRNELSHKRDGANMVETHGQIQSNIERFEHIVRTYILQSK